MSLTTIFNITHAGNYFSSLTTKDKIFVASDKNRAVCVRLKHGNITSILKEGDAFDEKNYRPISVLPSLSKIFERLIENQVKPSANSFLNPLLCGHCQSLYRFSLIHHF